MSIPSWIWAVAASLAPIALNIMLHSQLAKEIDQNERHAAPSPHQLRWHIRHIRQDVVLIAYQLTAIVWVLIYIAWRLTP
jgi:hypothetical protein